MHQCSRWNRSCRRFVWSRFLIAPLENPRTRAVFMIIENTIPTESDERQVPDRVWRSPVSFCLSRATEIVFGHYQFPSHKHACPVRNPSRFLRISGKVITLTEQEIIPCETCDKDDMVRGMVFDDIIDSLSGPGQNLQLGWPLWNVSQRLRKIAVVIGSHCDRNRLLSIF